MRHPTAILAAALRASQHTVLLTGPGVSAESGVPTFRQAQTGLWARYHPEELATPEAFERDPALVWQWYQWCRQLIASTSPNPAHVAIAALERIAPRLTVATQNIDGLHQRAGSTDVLELHGNIFRNRCASENTLVELDVHEATKPPRCPACGALVRPDVAWYGEPVSGPALALTSTAAADCELFILVGTSSMIEPAAGLAGIARSHGAQLAEIAPLQSAALPKSSLIIDGPAGTALPEVLVALE